MHMQHIGVLTMCPLHTGQPTARVCSFCTCYSFAAARGAGQLGVILLLSLEPWGTLTATCCNMLAPHVAPGVAVHIALQEGVLLPHPHLCAIIAWLNIVFN